MIPIRFPKITIGIPTYNRYQFVKRAIDSALQQTYPNIEVLVSDNASTDDTAAKLSLIIDKRFRLIRQEKNIGLGPNWNCCLNEAAGEFFLMLSDDDTLSPGAVEKLSEPFIYGVEPLGLTPDKVGLSYCKTNIVDQNGKFFSCSRRSPQLENGLDLVKNFLKGKRDVYPCSTLFRRSDGVEIGGYDWEKFYWVIDGAMWAQISLNRDYVVFSNLDLTKYTLHSENVTTNIDIPKWVRGANNLGKTCSTIVNERHNSYESKQIEKLIKMCTTRMVFGYMNAKDRVRGKRLNTIKEYYKYKGYFRGLYGFKYLFINVLKLLMPNSIFLYSKKKIGQIRNRQ